MEMKPFHQASAAVSDVLMNIVGTGITICDAFVAIYTVEMGRN